MQGLIVFSGRDGVKDQFTTVTDGGNITIIEYTGKATVVSIPEKINGLPVTAIHACSLESLKVEIRYCRGTSG